MTIPGQLKLAGVAVALYAGWNARSLFDAWQHSPFDHWDVVAWMIWIIPPILSLRGTQEVRLTWIITALVLTFAGALLDLNLLRHLGFAVACAGLTAPCRGFWLWLPMALTWMPAFGWLLSKYGLGLIAIGLLRVGFATAGTIGYVSLKR